MIEICGFWNDQILIWALRVSGRIILLPHVLAHLQPMCASMFIR